MSIAERPTDAAPLPPPLLVSVVVPVYAGEAYLERLVAAFAAEREHWAQATLPIALAEVIMVDDAARDASPEIVDRLAAQHSWVRGVHLSRNFGQHPATVAGILHSSGDWVATIDEDLQHPPDRIVEMLTLALGSSRDVVYAKAQGAVHRSLWRDLGSRGIKWLIRTLSANRHVESFNSFRLIRGSIARATASVCGYDTYFDIAVTWFTERIAVYRTELVDERVASKGRSGYSLLALLRHARRMMVSSGLRIFRIGGMLGLVAIAVSVLLAAYVLISSIFFPGSLLVRGWASLMVAITFFFGVTIFLVGIAVEFLGLLVSYRQGRPTFFSVDRSQDRAVYERLLARGK